MEVQQGTFHILLGPNGCGKSTLLRVLGGLLNSDSGNCQVVGPVGFVFQNPDHQVVMPTVAADVAFGLGRSVAILTVGQGRVVSATSIDPWAFALSDSPGHCNSTRSILHKARRAELIVNAIDASYSCRMQACVPRLCDPFA